MRFFHISILEQNLQWASLAGSLVWAVLMYIGYSAGNRMLVR